MKRTLLALAFLPSLAIAQEWQVDPAKSSLTFTAEQAGDVFGGGFKRFTPAITFDATALDKTNIRVSIDLTSVEVEGSDRQAEISNTEWLDTKQFTSAEFSATSARKEGDHYIADGTLNLKGIKKPVSLNFSLSEANGTTTAKGTAQFNRRDFNVGAGSEWESDQWVAFPVHIQFTIVAKPKS
ncbi:MAG: YceI family protein [Alphaproteobacteria bacterium]|nr:YceI family protein [Alphaproteobacteria bacterium]